MAATGEIARLVAMLGSSDSAELERALVLLALHGRKAVEDLIGAAASTQAGQRAGAVTALGRLGDPRGRRSVLLALSDSNIDVRAAAAAALSAYASARTCERLAARLGRESEAEVRRIAVGTLVGMYNAGTVEALDPLLTVLQDRFEDRRVRLEALKVLASLPAGEARAIARGLATDPDGKLAQAASVFCGAGQVEEDGGACEALAELHSPDYFTHRRGAALLASLGDAAIPVLVKELRERAADAASCSRVGSVLRQVARGHERAVAPHLEGIDDIVPLGLMVDIIGESRDLTALYHLKAVIDRIESIPPAEEGETRARQTIVAKAHYYLARAGSRVAFDSLKSALAGAASGERPLIAESLLAVQEIGGREELIDLLALYAREEGWMKDRIREAFGRLMSKARVKNDDRVFERLAGSQQAALAELLAFAAKPRRPRSGSGIAAPAGGSRRADTA